LQKALTFFVAHVIYKDIAQHSFNFLFARSAGKDYCLEIIGIKFKILLASVVFTAIEMRRVLIR